jgi:hypothetical protein
LIPGIIIGVYLVFYMMEFVDQNKRGMDTLLSSWAIVDGRWWNVFWKIVITGLMIVFPYFIIISSIAICGIVTSLFLGISESTALVLVTIFGVFVFLTLVLFIIPLNIISIFEIYYLFRNSRDNKRNEKTDKDRIMIIKVFSLIGLLYFLFELINKFIGQ